MDVGGNGGLKGRYGYQDSNGGFEGDLHQS